MRKQLVAKLFEWSQGFYVRYFKQHKTPWGLSKKDLLQYPNGSLGYAMGQFLDARGFQVIAKVERHDAYHVLLNFNTQAQDEVALQYLCFANGKRSKYLFGVILIGTLVLPEYLGYYLACYRLGKRLNTFYHFDYKLLLEQSLSDLQTAICTQNQQQRIFELNKLYRD